MLSERTDRGTRSRIGRYVVLGRIGKGGMGMVYRGLDEALDREVAVKTLTGEGNLDGESRKRFEVEAKAAARLQHPNIVTVFERGEDRGVPFIAMEMLPGVDLEALIRSGEALPLEERLDIVIQVARGLAYAHENRIVHRDIKPSNIRLLDDGTAKIMDFGIAKQEGTQLTKTGMMLGTIHYMSPEQVRGQKLDGRSDVFSLGVILYELLAGRRPFKGEGATDVLYKIVHEEPPPLDLAGVGALSPQLQPIVSRALAKEVQERYATASQLADDLASLLEAQKRAEGGGTPSSVQDALAAARRQMKEGRMEEGLRHLRELQEAHPRSLETRRALRSALREKSRRDKPPEPEATAFPELEATFQNPPTSREPETVMQPTVVLPEPKGEAAPRRSPVPFLLGGAGLLAALAAGILLLRKPEAGAPPPPPRRRPPPPPPASPCARSRWGRASSSTDGRPAS